MPYRLAPYATSVTGGHFSYLEITGDALDHDGDVDLRARLVHKVASRMTAGRSKVTEPLGSPVRGE
jgi:hypothetical protein